MSFRLAVAAILALNLSALAQAQYNRRQPVQQPVIMQQGEVEGTIQVVMQGEIMLIDANNRPVKVAVQPEATVSVTGTATADYLKNGMVLEFSAEIDGKGAAKEAVSELKIVDADKALGLFSAGAMPDSAADDMAMPAKRKPAKGAKSGAKTGAKTGTKAGTITPGAYRVVGRISSTRGGKLAVRAGRSTVTFELSDTPTVNIESSDLLLAAPGDKISANGIKASARGVEALSAKEVKIELAEPLSGPKKKAPAAKSAAKRSTKQPKKGETPTSAEK